MLIIPAIDIIAGKCVRLIQGDYNAQRDYDADPLETAQGFVEQGAQWVHVVDLDGAKSGEPKNLRTIRTLANAGINIEFGGGVRSLEIARHLLDLGVGRVVVGTKLVQDPALAETLFTHLGEQVVGGIDCRDGNVATQGWLEDTQLTAQDLAKRVQSQGASRIILTDIARDGMLSGPNKSLLTSVINTVALPVIHSGGIGSLDHIRELAALPNPPEAVIVGRALYEGKLDVASAIGATKS